MGQGSGSVISRFCAAFTLLRTSTPAFVYAFPFDLKPGACMAGGVLSKRHAHTHRHCSTVLVGDGVVSFLLGVVRVLFRADRLRLPQFRGVHRRCQADRSGLGHARGACITPRSTVSTNRVCLIISRLPSESDAPRVHGRFERLYLLFVKHY